MECMYTFNVSYMIYFSYKIPRSKKYDEEETGSNKRLAELKRKRLTTLLGTPVFPKGFSGKFPHLENAGDTVFQAANNEEKAIDVMKTAMETNLKTKKKHIRLYKPKNKDVLTKDKNVIIKLNKSKDGKRNKKNNYSKRNMKGKKPRR